MPSFRGFKDKVLHRHRKPKNAESPPSQPDVHTDRTPVARTLAHASQSSTAQSQVENPLMPEDLWQAAFNQLDEKERVILQQGNISALTNQNGENHSGKTDLVNEVIQKTKEQYEEYLRGGIKIKRSTGEDIDLRKVSGKIIDAALSFKEIISAVVSFDPTGHAASAWAVVSLGLTMTKNYTDRRDAVFDSPEYLADVLARCAYIEKSFYRNNNREKAMVGDAIVKIYKSILQYAAEILTVQNSGTGRDILNSITVVANQRLTQLQSSIEEEEKTLHQWVQLDRHLQHGKEAENILTQLDEISKNLRALVQKFSLPIAKGAFYNAYENQHEDMCLADTRIELRWRISQWAESRESECIFWLSGMAGTGKSTIARTMAKSFEDKGQLGASFFFKKGEPDRANAKKFVSTIAKQLMTCHPHLAGGILEAIETDPDISEKSLREQFKKLILLPLQTQESNRRTMVIVIDALDECEKNEDIRTILKLVPQVQDSASIRLKVFLTSRPELHIRQEFQLNHQHEDLVLDKRPKEEIEHDIQLYLEDSLSKISKDNSLPADWPGTDAKKRLIGMSVPLFIFAATLCRFVGDGIKSPEDRLDTIMRQREVSGQMESIYQPVLEQLQNPKDKNESKDLAAEFCEIVGVIVLLTTPLSARALGKLLDRRETKISFLLKKLHSVLRVPEDINSPVRILHLSFREFLLDTESAFHVDEKETNRRIASDCLRVMNTGLRHNICGLSSYATFRKDIKRHTVDQHLPADLQYSCRYWMYHLEQSEAHISEMEVFAFFKKHLLHWFEAMSLMGTISEAMEIIHKLQSLEKSMSSELSEFLYDTRRFILKHMQVIDTAPLQLYCSALVFSPTESVIRKMFEDERARRIGMLPQVQTSWSAELQTLEGHSKSVHSVAFSRDSRILASGSGDKTIKLWDIRTGKTLHTLEGHASWIRSVAFSPNPNSRIVASGSDDATMKLWDTETGEELHTLEGHSGSIRCVAFSPDPNSRIVASGSHDATIKLWDTKTGEELHTLKGHSGSIRCVVFSLDPKSRIVASGSDDATVKLWDTKTGEGLHTLEGNSDSVQSVALSPNPGSQMLALVSGYNTINLWDISTRKQLHTFEGHGSWIISVALSPDPNVRILASGSDDATVKLWDTKTGKELQTLKGHSGAIPSVVFSPDLDSQMVASGSHDSTVKLWDVNPSKELQTLKGHLDSVNSMALSLSRLMVATGSADNSIKLWDVRTGKELHTLLGYSDWLQSVALSPDGQLVASGSIDGIAKIWDVSTSKELHTLLGHSDRVISVQFSPDSQLVATGSGDNSIKLWDVRTGKELHTLLGHLEWVQCVAFSPDGQLVASGSDDGTIKLWSTKTGKELQTIAAHSDWVWSIAYSPNGKLMASGSIDGTTKLWDAQTGKALHTIEGHSGSVRSVTFSTDSLIVTSVSTDQTVKLWDTQMGKELQANKDPQTLECDSDSLQSITSQIAYNDSRHVSIADRWISFGCEPLIWLPFEYCDWSSLATQEGTLVLGYPDGKVLILNFYTD